MSGRHGKWRRCFIFLLLPMYKKCSSRMGSNHQQQLDDVRMSEEKKQIKKSSLLHGRQLGSKLLCRPETAKKLHSTRRITATEDNAA
uniref:Putative secreted protein n=1 Tax=Anopheles darlingi TaxID=43151 RepID=A0A2M4D171_ANODA